MFVKSDQESKSSLLKYRKYSASAQYGAVSSFFFLHGYITMTFAELEDDFGALSNATPQILLSGISSRTGKNESGFQHDAAVFVGSQPVESVHGVLELHFVRDALNPVVTEAKLTWDILDDVENPFALRLTAGRFWWPFGIHSKEWMSAANKFNLVSPAAAEVVPAHYNEVGVMLQGETEVTDGIGINSFLAVGNGVSSFELRDNVFSNAFDANGDRTVTTGLEIVPAELGLRVGASLAFGGLREGNDTVNYPVNDSRRFAADFTAYGVYATLAHECGFDGSGYLYWSEERLAGVQDLSRIGATLEASYKVDLPLKRIRALAPKLRYSFAEEDRLNAEFFGQNQIAFGVNAYLDENFIAKIEYAIQEETNVAEINNNAFDFSLSMSF